MLRARLLYSRPPGMRRRDFLEGVRRGNEAAVEDWQKQYRAKHFEASAGTRYGYQKRSGEGEPSEIYSENRSLRTARFRSGRRLVKNPKYYWRKWRQMRHKRPLVWSGASERASRIMKIVASFRKGEGRFPLMPRHFWQYRTDLGQPNKAAELTTIIESEVRTGAAAAERELGRHVNAQR